MKILDFRFMILDYNYFLLLKQTQRYELYKLNELYELYELYKLYKLNELNELNGLNELNELTADYSPAQQALISRLSEDSHEHKLSDL